MRVGIAHHLGWAVVVTADDAHAVVDRRRVELVDGELAGLVASVRTAARRLAGEAFDELAAALDGPVASVSVRAWPDDFPVDVAVLRRPPYESRADSVMYCQVLAEAAAERGWAVHRYDARTAEASAASLLGDRADDVLRGPRARLGPPWTKDHRTALAATVIAAT
jgi:hypothetical protein